MSQNIKYSLMKMQNILASILSKQLFSDTSIRYNRQFNYLIIFDIDFELNRQLLK